VFSVPLLAAVTEEKTPTDVFLQVERLADDVRRLRRDSGITTPWPDVAVESGHEPSHVYQKALEVLEKISRHRIKIIKTGGITVPRFPGRDITPSEVFSVVVRLRQELALLVPKGREEPAERGQPLLTIKVPSDVYAALSEVSIALEETLGLRGITPSEVFVRSQQVVDLVLFLRKSQSLPLDVAKPLRTQGKLPNHALQAVHELLRKIGIAEQNLWMKPLIQPVVPRRVITPSDVYDAMGVTMAELQRIQFRLGLEREFPLPQPLRGKSPDDVIQNTVWASTLLPQFELDRPLTQYDRSALQKGPDQLFSITEHILKRLNRYRQLRGIQAAPRKARYISGLKPHHLYDKLLEIMERVDVLRRRENLGPMAIPSNLMRTITPFEIFVLTLRLDSELALIHQQEESDIALWATAPQVEEYEGKQPSDLFFNMQRILDLLDLILGSEGYTPNDVYREVLSVKQDVELLAEGLGQPIASAIWRVPTFNGETEARTVFEKTQEVQALIVQAKRRAGMFGVEHIMVSPDSPITATSLFNQMRLIETELTELKIFLGITSAVKRPPLQEGKRAAHLLQLLQGIADALRTLLHIESEQG